MKVRSRLVALTLCAEPLACDGPAPKEEPAQMCGDVELGQVYSVTLLETSSRSAAIPSTSMCDSADAGNVATDSGAQCDADGSSAAVASPNDDATLMTDCGAGFYALTYKEHIERVCWQLSEVPSCGANFDLQSGDTLKLRIEGGLLRGWKCQPALADLIDAPIEVLGQGTNLGGGYGGMLTGGARVNLGCHGEWGFSFQRASGDTYNDEALDPIDDGTFYRRFIPDDSPECAGFEECLDGWSAQVEASTRN